MATTSGYFYVPTSTFTPIKTEVFPGSKITTASFFQPGRFGVSYLFLGTDRGELMYLVTNDMNTVNSLPFQLQWDAPITGVTFATYPNGMIGICVVTDQQVYPYLVNSRFELDEEWRNQHQRITQLVDVRTGGVRCERNMLAAWCGKNIIFEFLLDAKNASPETDSLITRQQFYTIPEDTTGYCVMDEFMLSYNGNGHACMYCTAANEVVTDFVVSGARMFVFDPSSGAVYAVMQKTIAKLIFDRSGVGDDLSALRLWIYNQCLAKSKDDVAVHMLLRLKLDLDQLRKMIGRKPRMKLRLYKEMMLKIMNKGVKTPQARALAIAAVDLYAMVEAANPRKHDVHGFVTFVRQLMKADLIAGKTVYHILRGYSWYDPLPELCDPKDVFNELMALGRYKEALALLPKMSDDDFGPAALRILKYDAEQVCKALAARNSIDNLEYVPILMSDCGQTLVRSIFPTQEMKSDAMARIVATVIAQNPTKEIIEEFLMKRPDDLDFLVRSLVDSGKYLMAGYAFAAMGQWMKAVLVAAKENPSAAFDLIPSDISSDDREQYTIRVLKSLSQEKASEVAMTLIKDGKGNSVDMAELIKCLPRDTTMSVLYNALCEFVDVNRKRLEEQQIQRDEALKGIEEARLLRETAVKEPVSVSSMETCVKCKMPVLSKEAVVYPCGHLLHASCVREIANEMKLVGTDIITDCPICGFLSVRMIDIPFRVSASEDRRWPADIDFLPSPRGARKPFH